jgi:DNA-binding HxlR family transcriptional regulator
VKRSYRQFCGIARALDQVGERWTLLIARDLLLGPRRYSELHAGLPGITTNLLAQRLKEMTSAGLVEKSGERGGGEAYRLTERGRELEPVLMALGRFGFARMRAPESGERVDLGWALLSTKRRYTGRAEATLEFRLDGRTFQVRARSGYVDVREGTPWEPEATVECDGASFRNLLYGGASARALEHNDALRVSGSREAWRRYRRAFALAA